MKIAYITINSPFDKNSWSGTNYYVRTALEAQGCNVYCIYEYRKITMKMVLYKILAKFLKKNYQAVRSVSSSKGWAKYILRHLDEDTDAIISLSTIPIAHLKTDIPIYLYIDGCYEYMQHQGFNRVMNNENESHYIETLAFNNCIKIFTSSIASADAINEYYGQDIKNKTFVIPFGANFDIKPIDEEVLENIYNKDMHKCKILFVGVDWKRKGAEIVLETVKNLYESGLKVELHLVGLKNIPVQLPTYVINHGFINKMQKEGMEKLVRLYKDSHFLFVPSIGEAFGLVFCEAGAYGLPSISHSIGGINTIIKDGINGKTFSIGTSPTIFAKYIKNLFLDKKEYIKLSKNTYQRFKEYLNWNVTGQKLVNSMRDVKNKHL